MTKLTQKSVRAYLAARGIVFTVTRGSSPTEFRVYPKGKPEAAAFTADIEDAKQAGFLMAMQIRDGAVAPSPTHEEQIEADVSELVEPEGGQDTYYGPVLQALWDQLNVWQRQNNGRINDLHDQLQTGLGELLAVATQLDQAVEDSNVD